MERLSAWPSQSAMTAMSTPARSSRMAQVWRRTCGVTRLAAQAMDTLLRRRCVCGEAPFDGVVAEPAARSGWGTAGSSAGRRVRCIQTRSTRRCRVSAGCSAACGPSVAADVGPGAEVDVAAGEPDQFGHPQPGLDGQQQQGVVAAPSQGARSGAASSASASVG